MNQLTLYRTKTDCLGNGILNLSEPLDSVDGNSFYGRIIKIYYAYKQEKPYVSLILPGRFEVLVDVQVLKKAGLTETIVDRIRRASRSERFEDLKETLLVEAFEVISVGEKNPLLNKELSPWKSLSESLESRLMRLGSSEDVLSRSKKFFNRVVELRRSHIFTVIRTSGQFAIVIGRRGEKGDVFIVSKIPRFETIASGGMGTTISKVEVEEVSDALESIPSFRSIVLKQFDTEMNRMAILEKRGNKSVQNLDEGIIEYLGEIIDDQEISWNPVGLLFPFFTADALTYLENLLEEDASIEKRVQCFIPVFQKIARALQKMHEKNLVHSDIKAENIFLSYDQHLNIDHVVLGDFGNTDPSKEDFICTTLYTFPEDYWRARDKLFYNSWGELKKRIDIRQLGFFFYDMLGIEKKEGNWERFAPYPIIQRLSDRDWPDSKGPYLELSFEVPLHLRALIKEMVSPEDKKVPSIDEIFARLEIIDTF